MIETPMNDDDTKKLRTVLGLIAQFGSGEIDINSLRTSMKAIYWSMDKPDQEWTDIYEEHWGAIEQLYARTLFEGQSQITGDRADAVREAVDAIRTFINTRLGEQW